MKLQDTTGDPVAIGAICVAERVNADGTIKIYKRTESDIAELISDMHSEAVNESEILTTEFWLAKACDRMAADECGKGECTGSKTCKQVSNGNFTYCRCKD